MDKLIGIQPIDQLLYLFALFGSWYILGASVISLPFRQMIYDSKGKWTGAAGRVFVDMLGCPSCYAFWAGWIFAYYWPTYTHTLVMGNPVASVPLIFGAISCGLNTFTAVLLRFTGNPHNLNVRVHIDGHDHDDAAAETANPSDTPSTH